MQLDIKKVFQREGSRMDFECTLDLSGVDIYDAFPFTSPVSITGTVENQNLVVVLRYRAVVEYSRACDRCLDMTVCTFDYHFEHVLASSDNGDQSDELVVIPDFILDFDQLACEDILLEIPTKHLCSPDCAGLCPKCGCNLNHDVCGCERHEPDPRLAALKELL